MWLRAPEDVKNVLWEGSLEPETPETAERVRREFAERGIPEASRDLFRNPPSVSIGQPEIWSLPELYSPGKLPYHLRARLEVADFYMVRLSCSFRSKGQGRIRWAEFLVRLLPHAANQYPIAYDMHPLEVYQEVRRQVRIALNPTLNFQPLEVGVGGAQFGIEYPELRPIVTATGIGEYEASWAYEEQKGIKLQGAKVMHLLVKAPKGMPSGEATVNLEAEINTVGILSFHIIRREEATPLKVQLWG